MTRSDQAYIEYAHQSEFQSFCYFKDGAGTLVSESWVLTAKHVAEYLSPGDSVFAGQHVVLVKDMVLYPESSDNSPDLALVELDRPIESIVPAKLPGSMPQTDSIIHIIGRGDFGTGLSGPQRWDKIVRAATNRIDTLTPHHLIFQFDAPDSDRTTDLEGISGPGDSGGPAYQWNDDGVWLVGVSSGQDTGDAGKEGVYGVTEYYVNVAGFVTWIESILQGDR